MEKSVRIRLTIRLFELLVRRMVSPTFTFKGGYATARTVEQCLDSLCKERGTEPSPECVADFCICQVYAINGFSADYLATKWYPAHSFGRKAMQRFLSRTPARRRREELWIRREGLTVEMLYAMLRDRSHHPLWRYLNPGYEEATKLRLLGADAGYYICGASTLLWNPFSEACTRCPKAAGCRERTRKTYPELYRIRCEELLTQNMR